MHEKIVLFTALNHGGLLQFTNQIAMTFREMGVPFVLFVPEGTKAKCPESLHDAISEYHFPKFAHGLEKHVQELAKQITAMQPRCVIATDDTVRCAAIMNALAGRVDCAIVIHDVTPHPHHPTLYSELSEKFRKFMARRAYRHVRTIILLSKHSLQLFCEKYPQHANKTALFPLGAHVMPAESVMPPELTQLDASDGFALFFGRIDVYKGVDRLIQAQAANCRDAAYHLPVVIAGVNLTGESCVTSAENQTVCICRFITDGEMIWLFEHCGVVVLPYREASQSGVLPIAYKFGKPVIGSAINGLQELIVQGLTGDVFVDEMQLRQLLRTYAEKRTAAADPHISEYYEKTYDWQRNIRQLLDRLIGA